MRKLIASTFVSLDGVMQAPGAPEEDPTEDFTLGGWTFAFGDDAMNLSAAGFDGKDRELVLGRKTYELFEGYWPHQTEDNPIARTFTRQKACGIPHVEVMRGIIRRYLAVTSFLPSPRSRGSPDATFKSLAAAISFRRYKLHRSSTNTIHGCTPSFLVVESGCLKKAQGHVHCGCGFEDFNNRRCDEHLCSGWRYFASHGWPSLARRFYETSHRHRRHLLQSQRRPALQAWYKRHLGIDVQAWGGTAFTWTDGDGKPVAGTTVCLLVRRKVTSLRPALQRSWSTTGWRISTPWSKSCAQKLQRAREDRRFRVREVCLGHRSRRKQGRTVATACRAMTMHPAPSFTP